MINRVDCDEKKAKSLRTDIFNIISPDSITDLNTHTHTKKTILWAEGVMKYYNSKLYKGTKQIMF